jgi:hypothetical protein
LWYRLNLHRRWRFSTQFLAHHHLLLTLWRFIDWQLLEHALVVDKLAFISIDSALKQRVIIFALPNGAKWLLDFLLCLDLILI